VPVGTGEAGCVLANLLSADGDSDVGDRPSKTQICFRPDYSSTGSVPYSDSNSLRSTFLSNFPVVVFGIDSMKTI
jgi:hypothetical protein